MKAKLRREIGHLLKEQGIPSKLYRGSKFHSYRRLRGAYLRAIVAGLKMCKVGEVVNDCDGLNHVIAKICPRLGIYFYTYHKFWSGNSIRGYLFEFPELEFEDGRVSCGDGWGIPHPAAPRAELEKWLLVWYEALASRNQFDDYNVAFLATQEKRYARLKSGGHIMDERGVLLKEFTVPIEAYDLGLEPSSPSDLESNAVTLTVV